MNRYRKEEEKRGSKFPSEEMSQEEWNRMVAASEENSKLHVPEFMEKDLEEFKKLVKEKSGK